MPKTYEFEFEAPPEQVFQETLGAVNLLGFSVLASEDGEAQRFTAPSVSWKTCSGGASNSNSYVFGTGGGWGGGGGV